MHAAKVNIQFTQILYNIIIKNHLKLLLGRRVPLGKPTSIAIWLLNAEKKNIS